MAKCMATIVSECHIDTTKLREELDFLKEDLRAGEKRIEQTWFERLDDQLCDLANTFETILTSCLDETDSWDCSHQQETLANQLSRITNETNAVITDILVSELPTLKKHRYFILFAYGTVNQLENLLSSIGRLSELDQRIYHEDQCKPLVCEESIVIHSLTSIWTSVLNLMNSFQEPASQLFNVDKNNAQDQDSLIQSLDFSTTSVYYHKVFLMDLIATSWIQFNRLPHEEEQLTKQLPLLCPCHTKQYFKLLERLGPQTTQTGDILNQLLSLVLAPQSKPSLMTQSVKRYGIAPNELCFAPANQEELAYFVVWHLCSISRLISDENRPIFKHCQAYLVKCASIVLNQFLPAISKDGQQLLISNYRVSPHQEERLNLLLLMLNSWCEKNGLKESCLPVATLMFSFFNNHWNLFKTNYLDNCEFRVGGLTVFQLFTKIIDEVAPLYTIDGHAHTNPPSLTPEQKQLKMIWNSIVERKDHPDVR